VRSSCSSEAAARHQQGSAAARGAPGSAAAPTLPARGCLLAVQRAPAFRRCSEAGHRMGAGCTEASKQERERGLPPSRKGAQAAAGS
jgi:hypothetical protein